MLTDSTTSQSRVIVLCFDGTVNKFGSHNSNVIKFYGLLDKLHPMEQITYYQPGIGTYFEPGAVNFMLKGLAILADDGIAWYLSHHVMEGYKFLMQNYRPGDKICLFGFSRGAYTARVLAGFLHKMGLLSRDNEEQVPFAYAFYKRKDDSALAGRFRKYFCTRVEIDFIGVWETVASVGLIYGPTLPYTVDIPGVRVFRHAIGLDEHRARFQFLPFSYESRTKRKGGPKDATTVDEGEKPSGAPLPMPIAPEDTDVKEVWFAGCHLDIGGCAVKDTGTVRKSVSNITLSWMVNQAILFGCGINFDLKALEEDQIILDPEALEKAKIKSYPQHLKTAKTHPTKPIEQALEPEAGLSSLTYGEDVYGEDIDRKGKERDAEALRWPRKDDVSAKIHDDLKSWQLPFWWMMEILPTTFPRQVNRKWKYNPGINFGRGRKIPDTPQLHHTVSERRDITEHKYKPKANWKDKKDWLKLKG